MTDDVRYMGDGVYATFDGYQIYIWTSDGITNSPRIALDVHTMSALKEYAHYVFDGAPAPKRAYGNMCSMCRKWLNDGEYHICPSNQTKKEDQG